MRGKFLCLQGKKIHSRSLIYDDSNVSNENRAPSYILQAKVNLFFDVRESKGFLFVQWQQEKKLEICHPSGPLLHTQ